MKPFSGSINQLLQKCSEMSKEEIDKIDAEAEKNTSISFIMKEVDCSFEEAVEIYKEIAVIETQKVLDKMLASGEVKIVGYNEDGEALYEITKKGRKKLK
jgi:uncharacterized membrane protein YkoI